MQYALVAGQRREAFPGGKGICRVCEREALAKCGTRKVPHWAHRSLHDCDPWWENETPWHRAWKERYPPDCREVVHLAPDGEIHRSDIMTPGGIFIEVQHSHLPEDELQAREAFYGNLVWVLDGRGWRKNFDIYHELPDPRSDMASDLAWFKAKRHLLGANAGMFWRPSENDPPPESGGTHIVLVHPLRDIEREVQTNYVGHRQYDWVRPHESWLSARCPVYIDFGERLLARLQVYDQSGLRCVRLIDRDAFVRATIQATQAEDLFAG